MMSHRGYFLLITLMMSHRGYFHLITLMMSHRGYFHLITLLREDLDFLQESSFRLTLGVEPLT
jgi:hypothetical protein